CSAESVCAPLTPADWPTDDKTSADLQIQEIKNFVGRWPSFMEVAYSSADIERIVSSNRLAVVIGVEINNIGNFGVVGIDPGTNRTLEGGYPETDTALGAVAGLASGAVAGGTVGGVLGFVFGGPVGLVVGAVSGGASTAVAGAITGAALGTFAGEVSPYEMGQVTTGATVTPTPPGRLVQEVDRLYGEGVRYIFPIHLADNPIGGTAAYLDMFNWANVYEEGHAWNLKCAQVPDNICYQYNSTNTQTPSLTSSNSTSQLIAMGEQLKVGFIVQVPPPYPCSTADAACASGKVGNMNTVGLNPVVGQCAIEEMMSKGMLIDIDHMSDMAADQTIKLAQQQGIGYPLNSGHNSVRTAGSERNLSAAHYKEIGALHGMAGVGSVDVDACQWMNSYNGVVQAMGMNVANSGLTGPEIIAGFGTDQVLAAGMPPRPSTTSYAPPTPANASAYASYSQCTGKCSAAGGACYTGTITGSSGSTSDTMRTDAETKTGTSGAQTGSITACHVCTQACLAAWGTKTLGPVCNGKYAPSNVLYNNNPMSVSSIENNSGMPMSSLGNQSWNYNSAGVAQYGLLPDFLADVSTIAAPTTGGLTGANVVAQMQAGAQYFYQTWRQAENVGAGVKVPSSCMQGASATLTCAQGETSKDCGSIGAICVENNTCPTQTAQCPPGEVAKSCGKGKTLCSNPTSTTNPVCP
ncbi:MAG: hypothetical protein WCC31_13185, partial [Terracidiphilus sp.]